MMIRNKDQIPEQRGKQSHLKNDKNTSITSTDLLTRKEVADYFRVSVSTIHNWCKTGVLVKYGVGNRVYFKKNEIINSLIKINDD